MTPLSEFGACANFTNDVLVVGASSGIGLAISTLLAQCLDTAPSSARLFAAARGAAGSPDLQALAAKHPGRVVPLTVDITDPESLAVLTRELQGHAMRLQWAINCAGLLHEEGVRPEKSLAALRLPTLNRVFAVNAFGPILLAQALLPLLRQAGPVVFASLSARVGSIGDNRLGGWYAYRASKAAQNQLIRTLSIELQRLNPQACCLLLHPGTVDTDLSRPFQGSVPEGRLHTAQTAASNLLALIARAGPQDNGRFLAWDGQEIPW